MSTENDLLVEVLKAAGHGEAAEIAATVHAISAGKAEAAGAQEAGDEQAAPTNPVQQQAEALRDQMNASLTPWVSTGNAFGGRES